MENQIQEINVDEAKKWHAASQASFLDIRDPQSFQMGHIPNAVHVDESKAQEIIKEWDKEKAIVIYCYHGNTSYAVAGYFMENGFKNVWSLSGGFEYWKLSAPVSN